LKYRFLGQRREDVHGRHHYVVVGIAENLSLQFAEIDGKKNTVAG
jgi:hypothetical protein